jgi:uncharacterized membrane protein SpoIIM required for sporulation
VIVDLQRFLAAEEPYWNELEKMLARMESEMGTSGLDDAVRFHYLYQRAAADLARLSDFRSEPRLTERVQSLVARAYAEIHETRAKPHRLRPLEWFFQTFPRTFRRHGRAFALSVAVTIAGCLFGSAALYLDPSTKSVLMPSPELMVGPKERVDYEESRTDDPLHGMAGSFSAMLMTHNTQVSILTMAMGMTFGIGTIILLFYNGVILGAVTLDYVTGGEAKFLAGWLLPHGAIEIPAILIAGQAGLILGRALIGRGSSAPVKQRLREAAPDLVTLIIGVALLLIWAGVVEAFFSQYHEPVLPYSIKIAFGVAELSLLTLFLARSGVQDEKEKTGSA